MNYIPLNGSITVSFASSFLWNGWKEINSIKISEYNQINSIQQAKLSHALKPYSKSSIISFTFFSWAPKKFGICTFSGHLLHFFRDWKIKNVYLQNANQIFHNLSYDFMFKAVQFTSLHILKNKAKKKQQYHKTYSIYILYPLSVWPDWQSVPHSGCYMINTQVHKAVHLDPTFCFSCLLLKHSKIFSPLFL